MLTVTGSFDDGATYTVQITGRAARPVIGSYRAAALVELHLGESVSLSPTGPVKTVAGDDTASVLAVLQTFTNVIETSGEVLKRTRVPEN
ncbi:hypothetical protein [Streptomyces griseomycini]|uniref:Uncharacterized protein n=1 Tax=Streptomyces griseomycini TaxID=66895 RepID=A0A7W7PWF0_9ACTN|nr:hypothetical protein [Streptomyces griseomycini]MBB4902524.1 hypothetical protein [Streptomyces griseomycini]GGR52216.1 hypothetical protein GCM10015536_67160 [Streptomyces griseomycini]